MNRNYFQTPPVVLNLIIINVLIFMATALLPKAGNTIMEYCALSLGTPFFHVYQFITYMFLHANFEHIFFNMFALWMFGRTLEYELGQKRFLTYYMVCGIGAALIQYLTALAFGEFPCFSHPTDVCFRLKTRKLSFLQANYIGKNRESQLLLTTL